MIKKLWPLVLGGFALGLDAYVLAGLLPAMAAELETTQATIGIGVAFFTGAYAISAPMLASLGWEYLRSAMRSPPLHRRYRYCSSLD